MGRSHSKGYVKSDPDSPITDTGSTEIYTSSLYDICHKLLQHTKKKPQHCLCLLCM